MLNYNDAQIEAICRALAKTTTGPKMEAYIRAHSVVGYFYVKNSKWKVFMAYFAAIKREYPYSNRIEECIEHFMSPALFIGKDADFKVLRHDLNTALSFIGKEINERGKLRDIDKAETLSEAENRAKSLLKKVEERNMHPFIKRVCRVELLRNDFYDVVFEASKGVFERIRELSGYKEYDGENLIAKACVADAPCFIINKHLTESEKAEHKGFGNLLRGIHGHFRNPAAHTLKQNWGKTEIEVLEILGIISYIHRRLDNAHRTCCAKGLES